MSVFDLRVGHALMWYVALLCHQCSLVTFSSMTGKPRYRTLMFAADDVLSTLNVPYIRSVTLFNLDFTSSVNLLPVRFHLSWAGEHVGLALRFNPFKPSGVK